MEKISLAKVMHALRAELALAVAEARDQDIQFPIASVDLAFQVGVTLDAEAKGGINFWVLELGASGGYTHESIQTVTLHLEAPVDQEGKPLKITQRTAQKP